MYGGLSSIAIISIDIYYLLGSSNKEGKSLRSNKAAEFAGFELALLEDMSPGSQPAASFSVEDLVAVFCIGPTN